MKKSSPVVEDTDWEKFNTDDITKFGSIGPPVKDLPRCGMVVHVFPVGLLVFTCNELKDHRGSHYGLDEDKLWELYWHGPKPILFEGQGNA